MIIHLCFDGNFIEKSISDFELFYPNDNLFLIYQPKVHIGKRKVRTSKTNVIWYSPYDKNNYLDELKNAIDVNSVKAVVLHGLSDHYLKILSFLGFPKYVKVYWILWGFEFYNSLAELGLKQLIDNESPFSLLSYMCPTRYSFFLRKVLRKRLYSKTLMESLPYINYFCFWNDGEYRMLKNYFQCNIRYKYFQYGAYTRNVEHEIKFEVNKKSYKSVMVNHQASLTGNHLSVLKKLRRIDDDNCYAKIVPLSYGNQYIKTIVKKYGRYHFGDKFCSIDNYMQLEDYNSFLKTIGVAIFGQLRQEAAGNIIILLENGAKVFLREGNPLLSYYREQGYIVFSFEKDLNSIDDLLPLSMEEMKHNWLIRQNKRVYLDDFMPNFIEQ